jgi:NAD(P)-dependent dehydrogenase (short-subunit alcohol dehydrogenase family)
VVAFKALLVFLFAVISKSKTTQNTLMIKKVAVITGASRGIGKAVALDLAQQNYIVILVAKNKTKLEEVANQINKNGGEAIFYSLNVAAYDEVETCVNKVLKAYGRIDVLFNNAGVLHLGTINLTAKQIDEIIDINLKGAIYFASKVAAVMSQQRSGYIINLASTAGKRVLPGVGVYCASKFGLVGYSEALAMEMLPHNVLVSAICPSYVNTDMPQGFAAAQKERMIPTEQIVATVNFLLQSDPRAAIKEIVIFNSQKI